MRVRVVVPPEPIVMPEDVPGVTSGDARVEALIAAVTEEIDGPGGWLGRALGEQTLELVAGCFGDVECRGVVRLPYPPLIEVESIIYLDSDGAEQTLDGGLYRDNETSLLLNAGESWPTTARAVDAVRIRYRAGYNGDDVDAGGTGAVPERAKQAIIIAVQDLLRVSASGGLVRSEATEGIRSVSYVDGDKVSELSRKAAERLLSGLRVYAL